MGVTITSVQTARPPGAERRVVKEVTFDNSYASGGEPLTAAELGLSVVRFVQCNVVAGSESSTLRPTSAYYTPTTSKIHLIDSATGKEVESTKDMSKVVVQAVAYGH